MTIITRYKNGTLYNKSKQEFITLEDVRKLKDGMFQVLSSTGKKDITDEVNFLADVDFIRRNNLWHKAAVSVGING